MASKRYTTLEDHWNMMFGSTEETTSYPEARKQTNRPVSWHPGVHRTSYSHQSPLENQTMSSWVDRPSIVTQDDASSELSQFPGLDSLQSQFQHLGYGSSNVTLAVDSYATSPSWDTASPYPHLSMQHSIWSVPDWVQMTRSTNPAVMPTSNEMQAHQKLASEQQDPAYATEDDDSIDSDKILVGMGLYDTPEGYDSWFVSGQISTGKGLKLEETWEPPEAVDDDDSSDADEAEEKDMDEDDTMESEESEEEQSRLQPTPAPAGNQQTPVNMSGRSFLLDEGQTYTNEWWYHQLKQPTTAQDVGVGMGWL